MIVLLTNIRKPIINYAFSILLSFSCGAVFAQNTGSGSGSNEYYTTFEDYLTARLYLAKKYTSLSLGGPDGIQSLRYRPNSLTTLGINGSYRSLSLSLGSGFGFLNPNQEEKGKTRSFDFQTHIYTREWVTDIYGQFYKSYYLKLGAAPGTADKAYYVRPDIKVNIFGASVYRLLNGEEFSYRASFLQNEWQKQSAGSLLIGAEIYYGNMKGDSALVPQLISSFYPQRDIKRVRFFEIGPGAGYAYTAVYEENFFVTGSLTATADLSLVKEVKPTGSESRTTISPNATLRAVAGYNSDEWAATISWLHNSTNLRGRSTDEEYRVKTGEFRITIAKRFMPSQKVKKKLDSVIQRIGQ